MEARRLVLLSEYGVMVKQVCLRLGTDFITFEISRFERTPQIVSLKDLRPPHRIGATVEVYHHHNSPLN